MIVFVFLQYEPGDSRKHPSYFFNFYFISYIYKLSVVNAHLNELPVKFSVCVNESQDKLPTMYWLPKLSFTKDRTKLDLLLIRVLVLPLKFLNY